MIPSGIRYIVKQTAPYTSTITTNFRVENSKLNNMIIKSKLNTKEKAMKKTENTYTVLNKIESLVGAKSTYTIFKTNPRESKM